MGTGGLAWLRGLDEVSQSWSEDFKAIGSACAQRVGVVFLYQLLSLTDWIRFAM